MNQKQRVELACEPRVVRASVSKILPLKKLASGMRATMRYQRIAASIREVGLIEPLVVHPQKESPNEYILLDGHVRLEILIEQGHDTVDCLIAMDDEAYTYNHKVNQLSAIQEHFMIIKATKNGVSEERIAKTLNVDVASICRKRDLLVGICREAVELLKRTRASAGAISEIRKAKPMRQIEVAELMRASNNFTVAYAKCLIAATAPDQLIEAERFKNIEGLSPNDVSRMERELDAISADFKQIEENHGRNVLNLVIAVSYLKKLLDNARVVRYLSQNHPEILAEFQKVVELRSLEAEVASP